MLSKCNIILQTHCADAIVADSASTASAIWSGIKANEGTIGYNENVRRQDCPDDEHENNKVKTILDNCMEQGKTS